MFNEIQVYVWQELRNIRWGRSFNSYISWIEVLDISLAMMSSGFGCSVTPPFSRNFSTDRMIGRGHWKDHLRCHKQSGMNDCLEHSTLWSCCGYIWKGWMSGEACKDIALHRRKILLISIEPGSTTLWRRHIEDHVVAYETEFLFGIRVAVQFFSQIYPLYTCFYPKALVSPMVLVHHEC